MPGFTRGDHSQPGGDPGRPGQHCQVQPGQQLGTAADYFVQGDGAAAFWLGPIDGSLCQQRSAAAVPHISAGTTAHPAGMGT